MPSTGPDNAVHVVAGVILDDRRVFLTRRPQGRHLGGMWEFPGGKVATGEAPYAALVRELAEETGIVVHDAIPYVSLRYRYPEKDILLDVWRVTRFSGTPHGREGQAAEWRTIASLRPSVFPAADRLVVRRLQLPPLYAISAVTRIGAAQWMRLLRQALDAGLALLQLREPAMARTDFDRVAREAIALGHAHGARVLVNGSPELAIALGADGVHLNSQRLMQCKSRPLADDLLVGASCHNAVEIARAETIGADFVVLGPVRRTSSHPAAMPLGWEGVTPLIASTSVPVYALGGMQASDLGQALGAGAQGVAMISALWDIADVSAVVGQCRRSD